MLPPILVPNNRKRPLAALPDDLFDRIQVAAEWCQQTDSEFIKAAILDRLDDVETVMLGWDEGEQP